MTEKNESGYSSQEERTRRTAHNITHSMLHEFGDPNSGIGYIDPYEGEMITPTGVFKMAMEEGVQHVVDANPISTSAETVQ